MRAACSIVPSPPTATTRPASSASSGSQHGVARRRRHDQRLVGGELDGVALREQVLRERAHGLADARVGRTPGQGDTGAVGWR